MFKQSTRPAGSLMRACAAGLLVAGAVANAVAADYVTLSKRDGRHVVLGAEPAVKVGKAVIVRVLTHHQADREISAQHFLLACDGSWMTDNFAYLSVPAEQAQAADFALAERRSIAEMPVVIHAAHHFALQDSDPYEVGPRLKKHLRRLCTRARPAPANMLVPITETNEFDGQLLVFSIVAKPMLVQGDRVRAWFRTTFHTQTKTPGRHPDPAVPTGEYWMTLKEIDCKTPQAAELERVVYRGSASERTRCGKCAAPPMIPLQEHSIGDAERKMACRLFGKSNLALPL